MIRRYNYIYEKIVQAPNDLYGFIAYALYKRHKIEYIASFKSRKNAEPTDEDLEEFHASSCSEDNINRLRLQAQALISQILAENLSVEVDKHKRELQAKQIEELETIVRKHKSSFWYGVGQGVVASLVFAGMLTILALIIKYYGTGLNISIGGI